MKKYVDNLEVFVLVTLFLSSIYAITPIV